MERLTFVDEKGRVLFSPEGCGEDEGYTIIQLAESGYIGLLEEIAERFANYEQRLKEYEDIGLTPEQLREIDKLYAEKCEELAELERKNFSGSEKEINGLAHFIADLVIAEKETVLAALENNDKQVLADELYYAIQDCEAEVVEE